MGILGPRQESILDAWAETIRHSAQGQNYNFVTPTRTEQLQKRVDEFLESPTQETFEDLWSRENLRNATYGGAGAVLNNWNGTTKELAGFVRTLRTAESFDAAWERRFPEFIVPGIWELYGRLDPAQRPILNSWVRTALPTFGLKNPRTYEEGVEQLDKFREIYQTRIGHSTADTDHVVPLSDEIEQFLYVVETLDEAELRSTFGMESPTYASFAGWDAMRDHGDTIELTGLRSVLDAFTTATNSDAYETSSPLEHWGANHWETWKDDYSDYLRDEVFTTYDPTALDGADVEPFIDALTVARPISNVVPIYLLGGRWQPWDSFEKISTESSDEAAQVLSHLLDDESGPITDRLTHFGEFYRDVSDSGGERMSLATMLLMFVHPDKYAMYRYQMFNDFFSAFSEYDIPNGFNPSAYALMNEALQRVRADLNSHANHGVRMLDVHSLLWVFHRQGPP